LLRASTTPDKLRLLTVGLMLLCLGWGALAATTVGVHESAAADAVNASEPLSLDAQQMYQSLADADVAVSTGYLYGRTEPFANRQRYQHDIAVASADLKAVTSATGNSPDLSTLSAGLPVYTGYVEDGEIYNSLGYPAGGSFIEVASDEMHLTLLPAARNVYATQNARLTAASARATGLPLTVLAAAAGLVLCLVLYRAQRWLTRRTHRTINGGLFLASAAGTAALIWLVAALAAGRADLLQATSHGSVPAEALAQADIAALQARGDETLNLISRSGDADFQSDFSAAHIQLDAQLASAARQSTASAAGPVAGAQQATAVWFGINRRAQQLDQVFDYGAETRLVIGSGPGTSGALFGQLQANLGNAIAADQTVFAANATAATKAFTGLEPGVAVLAVLMAVGCVWGLSRRLAEYR
jgi:hypothetical protein